MQFSLHTHTHTHTLIVFKLLQNAFFSSVHRTFTKIGHHMLGHNASPNKYQKIYMKFFLILFF